MTAKEKDNKEIQFEQPSDVLLFINRYLIFIIAFIILVILVGGYFFLLKPKIDSINVSETRNTATEERRQDNEYLLTRIKELEAEYYDILHNRQEDLELLKKMVPEDPQIAEFFLLADVLAKKHGFQLENIDIRENQTPQPVAPPAEGEATEESAATAPVEKISTTEQLLAASGINTATVKFSVYKGIEKDSPILGEEIYRDFKDYLAELENNMRLLDVQSIAFDSIDAQPGNSGVGSYSFNLNLITYYR